MTPALLDVNMLIAMTWPTHIHHQVAKKWFVENCEKGWATCPITEGGFVRISSNKKCIEDAVQPTEARKVLLEISRMGRHIFWKDDLSYHSEQIPFTYLTGHRQVTDAYLLGLAIQNKGRLVTLDQGITHLLPKNSPHHPCLNVIL